MEVYDMTDQTSTMQQELETLEQMSREVCGICKGAPSMKDIPVDILAQISATWEDCPDCNGSGRKWEGFSRECPGYSKRGQHYPHGYHPSNSQTYKCSGCQGSGRIPISVAEAVLWGMGWAKEYLGAGACLLFLSGLCEFVNSKQGFVLDGRGESDALALFAAMKEME